MQGRVWNRLTPKVFRANDEMVQAMVEDDPKKAERLARRILMNPYFHNWAPANAMMGNVALAEGDYVRAEAFYRVATSGKINTPDAVWNNYADTLMHLGKLDEAEAIMRRQIAKTDEKAWPLRFTLAKVLTKKGGSKEEVAGLVDVVLKNAPPEFQR